MHYQLCGQHMNMGFFLAAVQHFSSSNAIISCCFLTAFFQFVFLVFFLLHFQWCLCNSCGIFIVFVRVLEKRCGWQKSQLLLRISCPQFPDCFVFFSFSLFFSPRVIPTTMALAINTIDEQFFCFISFQIKSFHMCSLSLNLISQVRFRMSFFFLFKIGHVNFCWRHFMIL